MDISVKYMVMAGNAHEIQALSPIERDMGFHWRDETKTIHWVNDGRCYYRGYVRGERTKRVWLPRQDELQEIFAEQSKLYLNYVLLVFMRWVNARRIISWDEDGLLHLCGGYPALLESWEQLWMAFVMDQIYGKDWSDDEVLWVESGRDFH